MDCYLTQTNLGILTQEDRLISFILFDNKYYSQIDGVAEGFPLGQTLAIFFCVTMKQFCIKDAPRNLDQKITKGLLIICYLKHLNIYNNLLNI